MTRIAFRAAALGAATLSLALAAPGVAAAACPSQNNYTGPVDGQWNLNANWSTGSFPTASQDVCIPAGKTVTIIENGNAYGNNVTIEAGATVRMRTDPGFSNTQGYFGDVDNAGTFEFTSGAGATASENNSLYIAQGKKFTNRGVLRTNQTGYTSIYGDIANVAGGQVQVNSPLRGQDTGVPVKWANAGTFTVAAGVPLTFDAGWGVTLEQTAGTFANNGTTTFFQPTDVLAVTGGTFTGDPPLLRQGNLKVTGGSGTARLQYALVKLAADVGPNWTIRLEDRGSDTTRLQIPAGQTYTNRGTIAFAKDPAPGTTERVHERIEILDGAKLINTGLIRADADVVNQMDIFASAYVPSTSYKDPTAFVQNGTLQVSHNLTVPSFTQNGGTTTVDAGKTLTVGNPLQVTEPGYTLQSGTLTGNGRVSASKVTNAGGVVASIPGGTPLNLSFDDQFGSAVQGGDYIQLAGGTLRTRLAAQGTGVNVGGSMKLAGTLDVAPQLAFTPPAGQTYQVLRALLPGKYRSGMFTTVTGAYAPTYELDGVDATAGGGTSSFTVEDAAVREGAIASFVVRRTNGTGTAAVHWALRETGSASAAGVDYGYGAQNLPQSGDLTFAAGETQKTIAIQTYGDGTPEADETFKIHLSHPVNVPIARADSVGTILNDDIQFDSAGPSILPNTGPVTVTLRGQGLTSRVSAKLRIINDPDHPIPAVSFTPSDDGLSAQAVFDTAGLQASTNWYIQLYAFADTNFTYRQVEIKQTTANPQPFVMAAVPAYGRGGVMANSYLHYGNTGGSASRPAFLRFSGYPAGADLVVDHLPAGAKYAISDGVAGRSVAISVGRIPAGASEYIHIGYTPTTTIPGHTLLSIQASMHFGDAAPPLTDLRAFSSATPLTPGAGELFASNMAFTPSGSLTMRYAESAATGAAPAVTHTGTRWTFAGDIVDSLSPSAKGPSAAKLDDPTHGLLTVDFNGGEFKISGPLQEIEGAYELSIDQKRLTECLKAKKLISQAEYDDLMRLAEGAVVLKGMIAAADKAGVGYGPHLQVMDAVMSGGWQYRVAGGVVGLVDQIANPAWGFDNLQDDEYQMLWLMQLCNEKDPIPEPEYDDKGNYKPSKYILHLLQSFDPNEKYGTQGGGAVHAVRSDKPISYTVGFQNLPAASAPAQTATVTDQLDPAKVDLSTFSLGPISVAGKLLTPGNTAKSWTSTVDLRPDLDLLLKIEAALDQGTGKVTWKYTSLNPITQQPTTDVTAGFLPPSAEGTMSYFVSPKAGIATGTAIAGSASIVFDTNAPIVTNVWSNLIDDVAPTGAVSAITPGCTSLNVSWSGADAASGVASYDVWASIDGGAWTPWRMNTEGTSSVYAPASAGHTYRFDVQARDLAGNLQSADRGDARSATVDCTPPPATGGGTPPPSGGGGTTTPKPWLKLGKIPTKLKKGALVVPATCPATETAGCKGKLTLTTVVKKGKKKVTVTLASASFNVKAGKKANITLKLSKASLKLAKKSALKVALTAKPTLKTDKRTAKGSVKLARVR